MEGNPVSATQTIAANIRISGEQDVSIRSNDAGRGSHITVITGLVMVTLFDQEAARTYCGA